MSCLTLCQPRNVLAHDLSITRAGASITADYKIEVVIVSDLNENLRQNDSIDLSKLASLFKEESPILADGIELPYAIEMPSDERLTRSIMLTQDGFTHDARGYTIVIKATLPQSSQTVSFRFPALFQNISLAVAKPNAPIWFTLINGGETSTPFPITGENIPEVEESTPLYSLLLPNYFKLGFFHILPLGLDHILFVVGLFLLSANWRQLLAQATAFTLAHSITLGLATADIFSLPSEIVEPLIALSIVIVGLENLLTKTLKPRRIVVVFAFGLLHGLGFAGVLETIGLPQNAFFSSLLAFNLGVEFGQIAVLAICFLAFFKFLKESWYRKRIVIPGSLIISVVGIYWTIARLL